MNKCSKCGTEFEGKFCPECGTAANAKPVCPNCGGELGENVKFCPNCGCNLASPQAAQPQVVINVDWRKIIKYLPVVFFSLWAALLWAFYSAPVTLGDGFLTETVNLYGVLKDEMMSDLYSATNALIAFAVIVDVYAVVFSVAYIKGSKRLRNIFTYASFALHIAIVICAAVFGSALNTYLEGFEENSGNLVAVVIALTVVFAVLQIVSVVLTCKFPSAEQEPKQAQPAPERVDWKQNQVLHKILQYAPLAIFALWALLLFAFMAAPVMKGEPPFVPNLNVYGFFDAEQLGGDKDLLAIVPAAAALLSFAVISTVYAAVLAVLQFKDGKVARWLAHYASALCYLCVIICTSVISVKFNAFAQGVDDIKGSFVGVTIAFTVVFLLLHIASLVGCKLFDVETVSPEECKQAVQRFREFVLSCVQHFVQWGPNVKEYRAYKKQFEPDYKQYKQERKTFVVQEVKQIPIRNYAAGVLNIVALAFLLLGFVPFAIIIIDIIMRGGYRHISFSADYADVINQFVFLIVAALAFIFTVVFTILSFSKKWRGAKTISVVNLFVAVVYLTAGIWPMSVVFNDFIGVRVRISLIVFPIFAFASLMAVVARVNRVRRRIAREYDERTVAENDPAHYAVVRHIAALNQTRKSRGNAFGKILCVVMLCCFVAAFAFGSVSATYRMIYSGQIKVLEEYREEYDQLSEMSGDLYDEWLSLPYEERNEVGFMEYACKHMGMEYDEQFAIENIPYFYPDNVHSNDFREYAALQKGWAVYHSAGLMQIGSGYNQPDLTVVYVCLFYAFGLMGFVFACVAVGELLKRRNDAGGWCCTAFAFALFLLLYNIVMQILQPSVFTGLPIGTLGLTLSIILFIVTAFLAILVATYSPIADFLAAVREFDSEQNVKSVEPLSAE